MKAKQRKIIEGWILRAKRAKLQQKHVAAEAKVTEANLSKYFNFELTPRPATIKKIEAVLKKAGV